MTHFPISTSNIARLDRGQGLELLQTLPLLQLGRMAFERKRALHGDRVSFVRNRQINLTNRCVNSCRFCGFSVKAEDPAGYELDEEGIAAMVDEPELKEVHIVSGLWPSWDFERSVNLVRVVRARRPDIWIKAFTAVELEYFARVSCGGDMNTVISSLIRTGVNQLPAGGAEVFSDRVRRLLCPDKISGKEWLAIHRLAHESGLPSNASLLFGHIETDEEIVDHLLALRELQDATHGFQAFVPLAYQPGKTNVVRRPASSPRCLQIVALSRLLLDNIPHVKAYWPSLQIETAVAALNFGADDLDGTLGRERIMKTAGSPGPEQATTELLERMCRQAGQKLYERDGAYNAVDDCLC